VHIQSGMGATPAQFLQFGQYDPQDLVLWRSQGEMTEMKLSGQGLCWQKFGPSMEAVAAFARSDVRIRREMTGDDYFMGD